MNENLINGGLINGPAVDSTPDFDELRTMTVPASDTSMTAPTADGAMVVPDGA